MPEFHPSEPIPWYGRYARIPGELTAFRVVFHDAEWWPVVDWSSPDGDETGRGLLKNRQRAIALARSVNQAKRQMGGQNGGSFLINEFGQVLVPSSRGNGERRFAGTWIGQLKFSNPFFPQEDLVLTNDRGLSPGDSWLGPYVGMMYQLSRRQEIYFWHQTGDEACKLVPTHQDQRLIRALKSIRGSNGCRFLVNPGGIVLTQKQNPRTQRWSPVYVGRINSQMWFTGEKPGAR